MSASQPNSPRLRLPAFGRDLLDLREKGLVPRPGWCNANVLIVLDSWTIAAARWHLVVKPDDNPAELDFLGCAGLDCILIYDSRITDRPRLRAAARSVLRRKPSSLAAFDVVVPHRVELIKSHKVGVELAEFADG
jgi:hypothetical protein